MTVHDELISRIDKRTAVIGIIGMGYVGLPLAVHFGKKGFPVIGFDRDRGKIDSFRRGESYIRHVSIDHLCDMHRVGHFDMTDDMTRLAAVDCIVICVPTPLTDKKEPDLTYIINTTDIITQYMKRGQLVVLESTTYPGTTEELILPRLEESGFIAGDDIFLAYSPEREDPGNTDFNAANTPKVVGGVTAACLDAATRLYGALTATVPVSSTRAAELTKILENTYRSVNIALVNELKVLAHRMDIDIFEVINAAASKPFGFTPFYPGPGLGGHCIPIDPFYLSWKAREFDFTTRFIQLAGEVNVSMPSYVITRTQDALNTSQKSLKGSRILILGMAYKKDVDDERESPGYTIMKMLIDGGAEVLYNDPWIPRLKPTRKFNFRMDSIELTPESLACMDAVIIVTDHTAYDYDMIVRNTQCVIDTRNATRNVTADRHKIVSA